jgi:hypothetical protein
MAGQEGNSPEVGHRQSYRARNGRHGMGSCGLLLHVLRCHTMPVLHRPPPPFLHIWCHCVLWLQDLSTSPHHDGRCHTCVFFSPLLSCWCCSCRHPPASSW